MMSECAYIQELRTLSAYAVGAKTRDPGGAAPLGIVYDNTRSVAACLGPIGRTNRYWRIRQRGKGAARTT